MKIFVPFSEPLVALHGLGLGKLVPFQLEYQCLHVGMDFSDQLPTFEPDAASEPDQAARITADA